MSITKELGVYGIVIILHDDTFPCSGEIHSMLRRESSDKDWNTVTSLLMYNTAVATVEEMIIEQACNGIDVTTEEYKSAIVSVVNTLEQQYLGD